MFYRSRVLFCKKIIVVSVCRRGMDLSGTTEQVQAVKFRF
jgi:hypothetical protein